MINKQKVVSFFFLFFILVTALFPVTVQAASTIGKTDIGGSTSNYGSFALGSYYTASETKPISTVYVGTSCGSGVGIKVAVWRVSDGALIGQGEITTTQSYSSEFVPVALDSSVELTSGQDYWFGTRSDASATAYYDAGDSGQAFYNSGVTYADFPMDPWSGSTNAREYSIYAEFDSGVNYYVTYYLTAGGTLEVDGSPVNNGTVTGYSNSSVLEFEAISTNASYSFVSFNFTELSTSSNPYNYTVLQNTTVWVYFSDLRRYVTFYESFGGNFTVEGEHITNASTVMYNVNTEIVFSAVLLNSTYSFLNYTWSDGFSNVYPYTYTVSSNDSVWCYFRVGGGVSYTQGWFFAGVFIMFLCIMVAWLIMRRR